jgi:hypothetical protein
MCLDEGRDKGNQTKGFLLKIGGRINIGPALFIIMLDFTTGLLLASTSAQGFG